jgi:hypothetical protein
VLRASAKSLVWYPAARAIRFHALTGSRGVVSTGLGVVLTAFLLRGFQTSSSLSAVGISVYGRSGKAWIADA